MDPLTDHLTRVTSIWTKKKKDAQRVDPPLPRAKSNMGGWAGPRRHQPGGGNATGSNPYPSAISGPMHRNKGVLVDHRAGASEKGLVAA
jgi:hypothetical protein